MPDGDNLFTTREWKPDFVICYKNRTMKIKKCSKGFYHPTKHVCTEIVEHGESAIFRAQVCCIERKLQHSVFFKHHFILCRLIKISMNIFTVLR